MVHQKTIKRRILPILGSVLGIVLALHFLTKPGYKFREIPVLATRWAGSSTHEEVPIVKIFPDSPATLLIASADCYKWKYATDRDPPTEALSRNIYQYDSRTNELTMVDQTIWRSKAGAVWHNFAHPKEIARKYPPWSGNGYNTDRVLRFDGKRIETAGKAVLWMQLSPDAKLVAVLSAEGYREGAMFFSPSVYGRRFHQIFQYETGEPVGAPVMLQDARPNLHSDTIRPTWSADSKYVVYTDGPYSLWVVPVVE
ncbi:MAG: hypothetical protein HY287_12160 [Planctomycetes bacterium]|nr:hypothetical protein [Planctomycetota bacterium]MBI3835074.1 hypothetical protein [Planctomycetota bacterium]